MGRWSFHLSRRTSAIVISAAALAIGIAVPSASFADNSSGCDFAATGTTQSCSAPLAGSTFAGGDGNLLTSPTAFGTTDWQNVAGLNAGFDLPSGTGDNSFGQGTKEDNPAVSVVSGSIPPQKSNLTRFYEASDSRSTRRPRQGWALQAPIPSTGPPVTCWSPTTSPTAAASQPWGCSSG